MARKAKASALTAHIGYWMRLVSNQVSHSFRRKLEASGVTVAEWVILREMYTGEDTVSPSRIAELTGLTRGAVSKLVDRLLAKNLVTRSEASSDRRFQELQLTAKATSLVPRLARIADANDEEFFSILSNHERKNLVDILQKTAREHRLTKPPVE